MQAYQEVLAPRMRIATEDRQKISEECQKFSRKITKSLSNGGWKGQSS